MFSTSDARVKCPAIVSGGQPPTGGGDHPEKDARVATMVQVVPMVQALARADARELRARALSQKALERQRRGRER